MKKYGLHGKRMAKEGRIDQLAAILLEAAKVVSKVEGCLLYLVSEDDNDSQTIWITEVWETKEAHDNSLKLTGVKELISKAIPILDGQPEKGLEFHVLGGFGIN